MPLLLEAIVPPDELRKALMDGVPRAEDPAAQAVKFKDVYQPALEGLPPSHQIVFLTALSYVEDFLQKQAAEREKEEQKDHEALTNAIKEPQ